jgi:precorrin-6Y C5,15-methyltransferase (decarboxylating)
VRLTVGLGARPGTTPAEVLTLLTESLSTLDDVTTLSTVDSRRELAAAVAAGRGWEVVSFPPEKLAAVPVPSPSARVASALGTPSVAEASALLAAARHPPGGAPTGAAVLIVGKRSSPAATIAVAAPAPEVTVVGIGADGYAGLSQAGRNAIDTADVLFGGPRQLALLPPPLAPTAVAPTTATPTAAKPTAAEPAVAEAVAAEPAVAEAVAAEPAVAEAVAAEPAVAQPAAAQPAADLPAADLPTVASPMTASPTVASPATAPSPSPAPVAVAVAVATAVVASGGVLASQERVAWPSPLVPSLPRLLAERHGRSVCVLASGDPMHYGIGTTLVRLLGAAHVHVVPHPSSISLACARLGWGVEDVEVVSAVGRDVDVLRRFLHDRRRLLVLAAGRETAGDVWRILEESGFEGSIVTILEALGGADERVHHDPEAARGVHIVAVECRGAHGVAVVAGLADSRYDSDGQLTKREIRAVTLAALGPRPGELLWDVGAGSGSIAVEWLRAHRACRAVAVERDAGRAERVAGNARRLGVPGLTVVVGAAPAALDGLEAPDAVFIGGGFTVPGVFQRCWDALRPGGRLVVNAVTVESERLVAELHAAHGGELTRIAVNRVAAVGGFLGWRPMLPVTQWAVEK